MIEYKDLHAPAGTPVIPRCCFCGRKIKNNPVTRFQKHGIEFLQEDEKAHKGCAFRQYKEVKEILTQMDS